MTNDNKDDLLYNAKNGDDSLTNDNHTTQDVYKRQELDDPSARLLKRRHERAMCRFIDQFIRQSSKRGEQHKRTQQAEKYSFCKYKPKIEPNAEAHEHEREKAEDGCQSRSKNRCHALFDR